MCKYNYCIVYRCFLNFCFSEADLKLIVRFSHSLTSNVRPPHLKHGAASPGLKLFFKGFLHGFIAPLFFFLSEEHRSGQRDRQSFHVSKKLSRLIKIN